MSDLTIRHSPAEGTVLDGATRADNVGPTLRSVGSTWRWSRAMDAWILSGSRDHQPRRHVIDRTAELLRAAGHHVDVTITTERRDVAEREQDKTQRAEHRAGYLEERAERRTAESDQRWQASRDAVAGIPMGQPILVGHHSESRHRAALARSDRHARASIDLDAQAKSDAARAQAAEATQRHRHSLPTTLRRIERLEADLRRVQRNLVRSPYATDEQHAADLARLGPMQDQLVEEIAHWKEQVAAAEAAGVKVWSRADFTKGDGVVAKGMGAFRVLRVNAKSLTVPHSHQQLADAGYTETLPYDVVTDRLSPERLAEVEARVAATSK